MNYKKMVGIIFMVLFSLASFATPNRLVLPLRNSEDHWGFCYEDGTPLTPFSFKRVYCSTKNRIYDAFSLDGSEVYVDIYGNVSTEKETLPCYKQPVVERIKSNEVYVLTHRDGRTKAFPDAKLMIVYDDGCATCVTKDGRGGFSNDPLKEDSWMYFAASTRSFVAYDPYDKIISYSVAETNDFGGVAWRYLNLDGSVANDLESAVAKYDHSMFSEYGWIPVLKVIEGVRRCGVLSRNGDELIQCNYDFLEAVSDYICCWWEDKASRTSQVTCFDGNGSRLFKFQVDQEFDIHESFRAVGYWYAFGINRVFCWVNVKDRRKIQCENGKIVVSQIEECD